MTRYQRAVTLMEADIADELVALDEARGLCFGFSSSAAEIWRALAEPLTLDQLVERLTAMFEVEPSTCRSDVDQCLKTMVADGLVVAN